MYSDINEYCFFFGDSNTFTSLVILSDPYHAYIWLEQQCHFFFAHQIILNISRILSLIGVTSKFICLPTVTFCNSLQRLAKVSTKI